MDSCAHIEVLYPEDRGLLDSWRRQNRLTEAEIARCLAIQRADPLPPRSLGRIAHDLGLLRRMSPHEALVRVRGRGAGRIVEGRRIHESRAASDAAPDYTLVRKMGSGGQGEAFLAQQMNPPRVVAVKRLLPEFTGDGHAILRFFEEGILMERVDSPRVARLIEYGASNAGYFIAMEYVAGESLEEFLRRRKALPLPEALRLFRHLCEAAMDVADADVVHCDLKPSNVILPVRHTQVKVIDFGASVESGSTQADERGWFGSPSYMAPEQFRQQPLTPRTDMYSLGIILYRMLTGSLPFEGSNALELGRRHMQEPMPSLLSAIPDAPFRLGTLIRRMTEKDPSGRPGNLAEVLEGVRQIQGSS